MKLIKRIDIEIGSKQVAIALLAATIITTAAIFKIFDR
jgi:hypothetical protein